MQRDRSARARANVLHSTAGAGVLAALVLAGGISAVVLYSGVARGPVPAGSLEPASASPAGQVHVSRSVRWRVGALSEAPERDVSACAIDADEVDPFASGQLEPDL